MALCVLGLFTISQGQAAATPGDLDPGFGASGLARFDLGMGGFPAGFGESAMSTTPSGGMVVAYDVPSQGSRSGFGGFGLRRYLSDGSLDSAFNGETAYFPDQDVFVRDVVVQADGKVIVVGGAVDDESDAFFVARFNSNGSLDSSFSGDGKANYGFGGDSTYLNAATSVALTPDGKIVVAGIASLQTWLIRLLSDGSLDNGFSGDGKAYTGIDHTGTSGEAAAQVAVQNDAKIVVAIGDYNFTLQRYNVDGTLDSSFAGDGQTETSFGTQPATARAVAVRPSGEILVIGQYPTPEFSSGVSVDFAVARYTAAGNLDASFSDDGKLLVDFGGTRDSAELIGFQADGKIVIGGEAVDGAPTYYVGLVRLTDAGQIDTGFSGDGKTLAEFAGSESYGLLLNPEATGILIGGQVTSYYTQARGLGQYSLGEAWNTRPLPAFTRLNLDGTLDTAFGNGGRVFGEGYTYQDSTPDYALSSLVQSDDRIVTVGSSNVESNTDDFAALRLMPDGDLDSTFSDDGRARVDFGPDSNDYAREVLPGSDSKLILAGTRYRDTFGLSDIGGDFALARMNADGTLDTSFSADGKLTTDLGGHDRLTASAIQADGKIVAVGATGNAFGATEAVIVRYNTDGTLDTSFSDDGIQRSVVEVSPSATAVVIQPSGKIVIGGTSSDGVEGINGFVLRYNADGTPDNTFAEDGLYATVPVLRLAMRSSGQVVVGGARVSFPSGDLHLSVDELTVDGESSFSFRNSSVEGMNNFSTIALNFDDAGRLLAVGSFGNRLKAVRLLADATEDNGYGTNGLVTIELDSAVKAADLDTQGEAAIVTGYVGSSPLNTDMLLARLQGGELPPPPDRTLTVTVEGPGTVTGDGVNCGNAGADCSEVYPDGSQVVLNQSPAASATFNGWSGGACSGTGNCVVTMNSDTAVTAAFDLILRTLTVNKSGTGTGSVTCDGVACASSYPSGTTVTLAATAASGSTFSGWSGGSCSGTGPCQITFNNDSTVTATFNITSSGGGGGGGSSGPGSNSTPAPPTPIGTKPKPLKCKKGFKKKTVHGKAKCVKVKKAAGRGRGHKSNVSSLPPAA